MLSGVGQAFAPVRSYGMKVNREAASFSVSSAPIDLKTQWGDKLLFGTAATAERTKLESLTSLLTSLEPIPTEIGSRSIGQTEANEREKAMTEILEILMEDVAGERKLPVKTFMENRDKTLTLQSKPEYHFLLTSKRSGVEELILIRGDQKEGDVLYSTVRQLQAYARPGDINRQIAFRRTIFDFEAIVDRYAPKR